MEAKKHTPLDDPWTNYWKTNKTGNSFADANAGVGNYSDDVQRFWEAEFGKANTNAVILDIATGNGAILSIAQQFSQKSQKCFSLYGVDKADVKIMDALHDTVTIFGQTDMSCVPMASSSVDVITSQFGFEYSDMSQTLAEIERLLKPQGVFTAICHHNDSTLTKSSRDLLSIYQQMEKRGFFQLCAADAALQDFGLFQNQLLAIMKPILMENSQRHVETDIMQMMKSLGTCIQLAKTQPLTQVFGAIRELSQQYFSHMHRLQQQVNASLDADKIDALLQAQSDSFAIRATERSFSKHNKVWIVTANSLEI